MPKCSGLELDDTDPSGFKKIDSATVQKTVEKINEALKDKSVEPKVRQKLNMQRSTGRQH